jgi:hypothetical protein
MFKSFEHGWNELAPDLKEADLEEVLRHLIELVKQLQGGSRQQE